MRIIPFLLALGVAASGAVVPALAVPVDEGGVTVVASPAFSGMLRPGQSLLVSGTITNGAEQAMDAGTATVYVDSAPFSSRADLGQWLASDDTPSAGLGTPVGSLAIGELAVGQIRPFSLNISASAIRLPRTVSGVYPLYVRLSSGATQIDLTRSVIVWTPNDTRSSLNLSIVAPLTAPASATGIVSPEDLERLTAPGGALDAQLVTANEHGLTLGVDPMIVASIRVLGTSAPQAALDWLSRLDAFQTNMFPLAYADGNLTLQRRAGADAPLVPTTFPLDASHFPVVPEVTPTPSGVENPPGEPSAPTTESLLALDGALSPIAWPTQAGISEKDLDFFASGGYSRTLLPSTDLIAGSGASPNATIGKHDVTMYDSDVSDLLRKAASAASDAEWSQAMASLVGTLAVSAAESASPTIVATLGRDGSAEGVSLGRTLSALDALPWIRSSSLADALELPAAPAKLADSDADPDTSSTARLLLTSEEATDRFASVVDDPTLVTGPQRLALLALLSNSWNGDPAGWSTATDAYLAVNRTIRSSVHLPVSSQINLFQEKGNLPIAVRNELDFPVTVYVTVQPERAILDVLDGRVELKIDANSQAKATVPVQSIANGEVRTMVSLSSATREPISSPTFVNLNVQAGWETAATVVLAIIVVALFGAGIWRTVLRRRKARMARREVESVEEPGS
ncbi:MAG: hypothetical protein KF801_04720 [Cryobacterium sp.]|jgi:hypothetical protein|nr:hypothetical protein [Cryobacterium sp.]